MEDSVDRDIFQDIAKSMDSIPPVKPLAIKTPILEVESDYGHPVIDGFMVVFVVAVVFCFWKAVKKWEKNG